MYAYITADVRLQCDPKVSQVATLLQADIFEELLGRNVGESPHMSAVEERWLKDLVELVLSGIKPNVKRCIENIKKYENKIDEAQQGE